MRSWTRCSRSARAIWSTTGTLALSIIWRRSACRAWRLRVCRRAAPAVPWRRLFSLRTGGARTAAAASAANASRRSKRWSLPARSRQRQCAASALRGGAPIGCERRRACGARSPCSARRRVNSARLRRPARAYGRTTRRATIDFCPHCSSTGVSNSTARRGSRSRGARRGPRRANGCRRCSRADGID